jgi:hypothetical protein
MKPFHLPLAAAAFALSLAGAAKVDARGAGFWLEPEPTIWKKILARPGEHPADACRRVFGVSETYNWSKGPGRDVYCRVSYANIYAPGEVRQNFNTRN